VKCDTLKKCSNFTAIKNSTNFHSILAQFKMICDDSDKPRNIQLILASGLLLGSIIGGHIGDWFGRQFLFYMSQLFIVTVPNSLNGYAHGIGSTGDMGRGLVKWGYLGLIRCAHIGP
jgi:hypothetical protein